MVLLLPTDRGAFARTRLRYHQRTETVLETIVLYGTMNSSNKCSKRYAHFNIQTMVLKTSCVFFVRK